MSKVIRAMKKVYWKGRKKIKKLPPVKAAKKYNYAKALKEGE